MTKKKTDNIDNADSLQKDLTFTSLHPKGSFNDIEFFNSKRKITRPDLHIKRVTIILLCTIAVSVMFGLSLGFILKKCNVVRYTFYALISGAAVLLITVIVRLKHILIWLVKVYQKFAPERIRQKCVFVPSCSEYMILALQKYGAIKGFIKGIQRLKRCHLPNHGEDYP